jgi:hypothetical protein
MGGNLERKVKSVRPAARSTKTVQHPAQGETKYAINKT